MDAKSETLTSFFGGESVKKIATLTEEDRKEIDKLCQEAETTPKGIGCSIKQIIEGKDPASLAWARVGAKVRILGNKYGFNLRRNVRINTKTGEVFPL